MARYNWVNNKELAGNNREAIKRSLVELLEHTISSMHIFQAWLKGGMEEDKTWYGQKVERDWKVSSLMVQQFDCLLDMAKRTNYFTQREIKSYEERIHSSYNQILLEAGQRGVAK